MGPHSASVWRKAHRFGKAHEHLARTTTMQTKDHDVFLGRQPILDRRLRVTAYELLFRCAGNLTEAHVGDDAVATKSVVTRAFRDIGIHTVVGQAVAFVNVDAESLLNSMIETLPREQVVLELLETVEITDQLIERCRALKAQKYRIALDDFCSYSEAYDPLLDIADIVKIDVLQLDPESLLKLVRKLRLWPTRLLAEKVETVARARECVMLGFDLFQGYLFGRPELLAG